MRVWRLVLAGAAILAALWMARPDLTSIPSRPMAVRALPDRPVRIVALGTSLTLRAVWPDRLGPLLAGCGIRVDVIRIAKAGAASDWGVGMLDRLTAERPDIVIVEFSVNDADIVDGLWPWASRANVEKIAGAVTGMPGQPQVLLVSTAPVVGIAQAMKRPFLAYHQAQYGRIADERALGFLNGTALWRQAGLDGALPDGVHPDPEREAQVMLSALAGAIAASYGRSCGVGANG